MECNRVRIFGPPEFASRIVDAGCDHRASPAAVEFDERRRAEDRGAADAVEALERLVDANV
jgi:hypothetical protein